jgi:hypothetical protein
VISSLALLISASKIFFLIIVTALESVPLGESKVLTKGFYGEVQRKLVPLVGKGLPPEDTLESA